MSTGWAHLTVQRLLRLLPPPRSFDPSLYQVGRVRLRAARAARRNWVELIKARSIDRSEGRERIRSH